MGMFDWYPPEPALVCPSCGQPLVEWQGTDGPCCLLVWRQGQAAPVEQRVEAGVRWSDDALQCWQLPADFWIYSNDCACRALVFARGRTVGGVWRTTEQVPADQVPW